jgi:NADPH-dependent curcumin reductase CurA
VLCTVLKRLTVRGFLAFDPFARHPEFITDATRWQREGKLRHHVTVTHGLANIHAAINSLMSGNNRGKQLCQIAEDPTL